MYPIIIDVEASGFGRGGYPIEIGVALSGGSRHCYLVVSPASGWRHGMKRRSKSTASAAWPC